MRNSPKLAALFAVSWFLFPIFARSQPPPQDKDSGPARLLFASANRVRVARRLPPLRWDAHLATAARRHALRMAQQNALSHQFPGESSLPLRTMLAGAHFSAVAENVAEGPTAALIQSEWMKSPPHRANLLDPELDSLGVAVVEKNGELFAVEDFSQALVDLSPGEQERRLRSELQTRGVRVLHDPAAAQRGCEGQLTRRVGYRTVFLLRYSTSDLDRIPVPLEKQIHTGSYRAAAVGACASTDSAFSAYHVAVLLYR